MSNWQEIWNKEKSGFQNVDLNDKKQVLLEMKRLVGWDHYGKGSNVAYETFIKEYEYMKEKLDLTPLCRGGIPSLRLAAAVVLIFTFLL